MSGRLEEMEELYLKTQIGRVIATWWREKGRLVVPLLHFGPCSREAAYSDLVDRLAEKLQLKEESGKEAEHGEGSDPGGATPKRLSSTK